MRCVTVCPAVSSQFNLLHPMTSIIWRKTPPLPPVRRDSLFSHLQCVVIGQKVFVVGWAPGAGGWPVVVYHIRSDSWNIHSWSPTRDAALTTYHSELVLIGGVEIGTGRLTNRVLVWQEGEWHPSLPPMTVARSSASAVSSGNLIIVAGGDTSPDSLPWSSTNVVELFNGHSWMMAQPLPVAGWGMKIVLLNGELYLGGQRLLGMVQDREVFRATVQSLVNSTENDSQSQVWTRLPPVPHLIYSVAGYNNKILAFEGLSGAAIRAYFPPTQSWVHVEDAPAPLSFFHGCTLALPTGDLMVVTGYGACIGQLEGMECDYCACIKWSNQSNLGHVVQRVVLCHSYIMGGDAHTIRNFFGNNRPFYVEKNCGNLGIEFWVI